MSLPMVSELDPVLHRLTNYSLRWRSWSSLLIFKEVSASLIFTPSLISQQLFRSPHDIETEVILIQSDFIINDALFHFFSWHRSVSFVAGFNFPQLRLSNPKQVRRRCTNHSLPTRFPRKIGSEFSKFHTDSGSIWTQLSINVRSGWRPVDPIALPLVIVTYSSTRSQVRQYF